MGIPGCAGSFSVCARSAGDQTAGVWGLDIARQSVGSMVQGEVMKTSPYDMDILVFQRFVRTQVAEINKHPGDPEVKAKLVAEIWKIYENYLESIGEGK